MLICGGNKSMRFPEALLLFSAFGIVWADFPEFGDLLPIQYHVGSEYTRSNLSRWSSNTRLSLSKSFPVLTLDFGYEVAGFPFITISSLSSPAEIACKYSESFASLASPYSDGPWTFSNGLSNSFRTETLNITNVGRVESYFIQGGQRWMVLKLLTDQELTISEVGFRATSPSIDVEKLPAHLKTDNELYNAIFDLGGRCVQPACLEAGSTPSTWDVTDSGVLIRGQTTAQSAKGVSESNYTLTFDTKIIRGGTGWRVASAIVPLGPFFVLTSNYPKNNTFSNTNQTLLPPNTLIFNSDWNIINQTSLITPANTYFPLNVTIEEEKWYRISTTIRETGYEVRLDGQKIVFVPLPKLLAGSFFASPSRYQGTWGFGGAQQHITLFKNVTVSANDGSVLYMNAMTSDDTLAEYSVAPLDGSVCLDGAKRDRLVWTGDFYHTVRVVAQSSARFDQLLATIKHVLSYQNDNRTDPFAGLVQISPALGSRPEYKNANPSWGGLVDYQDLFLAGIGEYFRYTGDVQGLKGYWPQIKNIATTKLKFIDPSSGLVAGASGVPSPAFFLGPANGSAVTGLFSFALDRIAPLALAFGEGEVAKMYQELAAELRSALNSKLWNDELGTYSLSTSSAGNFSLTGIAWAILSGAANETQVASSVLMLERLRLGVGYMTVSSDEASPEYALAPNPSGFLLEALFSASRDFGTNTTLATTHLMNNLWGSMVNNEDFRSGASWEYVKPDGSPGLELFTSLAHPWGAAPTYVMQEYLLGVQPTSPGYEVFKVQPLVGYLGIQEAKGRAVTPAGNIEVEWEMRNEGKAIVEVKSPCGVVGVLQAPTGWRIDGHDEVKLTGQSTRVEFVSDA